MIISLAFNYVTNHFEVGDNRLYLFPISSNYVPVTTAIVTEITKKSVILIKYYTFNKHISLKVARLAYSFNI